MKLKLHIPRKTGEDYWETSRRERTILRNFIHELENGTEDLTPEQQKALDEHFWDLL